jgi:hypothetical protein
MNYFYNGVELPALPEWDKEAYPYAAIFPLTNGTDGYSLVAIAHPWFARKDNNGSFISSSK